MSSVATVKVLVQQIRAVLEDSVERYTFVAIPRGGLIVLGWLSYHLDLKTSQISSIEACTAEKVVVVDDCCISGARFASALDKLVAREVIFAHLASTPEVRRAILENEPRVRACIAARDLLRPRGRYPSDEEVWERDRPRLPGKRYWLGAVAPFHFPWGEPDLPIWNEREQRYEEGWRRASPRTCLENFVALKLPPLPAGRRPRWEFDVARRTLWQVDEAGNVKVWHQRSDRVFGLEGVAGAMWRALVGYGTRERALEFLQSRFEVPLDRLRYDLDAFVEELTSNGVLLRR